MSRASDITARLTDPSGYTGAHKHRFGDDGRGRGREGRMDLVENDGYVTGARTKKTRESRAGRTAGSSPSARRAPPASTSSGGSPARRAGATGGAGRGRGRGSGRTRGSARSSPASSGGSGGRSRAADITARLTDPSKYTGAHKERFDASGRGRGKAGRVDVVENDGYVASFSSKTKSGRTRGSPARRGGARSTGSRAADITARLTDPSGYTGAHKERFDASGRGRGKAGRVDVVENDGYVGAYKSQRESGRVAKRTNNRAADITARLTDPSGYTGAHKERFDASGRGRGKAGRVDVVENDGYVASFSSSRKRGGSRTRGAGRR